MSHYTHRARIPYTTPHSTPFLSTPPPHSPSQWHLVANATPSSHSPSESPQRRQPASAARCGCVTRKRDVPLRQSRSCPAGRLRPLPCHRTSQLRKAAALHLDEWRSHHRTCAYQPEHVERFPAWRCSSPSSLRPAVDVRSRHLSADALQETRFECRVGVRPPHAVLWAPAPPVLP